MIVSLCDHTSEIFWGCIVFSRIEGEDKCVASLEWPLFGFVLPSGVAHWVNYISDPGICRQWCIKASSGFIFTFLPSFNLTLIPSVYHSPNHSGLIWVFLCLFCHLRGVLLGCCFSNPRHSASFPLHLFLWHIQCYSPRLTLKKSSLRSEVLVFSCIKHLVSH